MPQRLTVKRQHVQTPDRVRASHLIGRVFAPAAAGFFLQYLFRVINAPIGSRLQHELGIGAAQLGTLTAVFFFASLLSTVPLGALLDRIGPRRAEPVVLLVAAIGALIFAAGRSVSALVLGRALLGIGTQIAWLAALKATATWFSKERLPLINGFLLAVGTMGAMAATGPADFVVQAIGWRGLFVALAGITVLAAGLIYLLFPKAEAPPGTPQTSPAFLEVMREVLTDRYFLSFAPLGALAVGTAWAMQGLWAAVWLADVARLRHAVIVADLAVMACTLWAGGPVLGIITDRLRRCGVSTGAVFGGAIVLFMVIQALILLRVPLKAGVLWGAAGVFGSLTALNFAMMSDRYPMVKIGRANSCMTFLTLSSGFVIQAGIGYVLALWPRGEAGRYPVLAYQVAFAVPLLLQGLAFAWFLWCKGRRRGEPSSDAVSAIATVEAAAERS